MSTFAEPNLYDYWPYEKRPKIEWPGGKKLAFWIAPNIEYYEYQPPHNDWRQPWPKGNPDIIGFSQRDYGNRVGHLRLMELLAHRLAQHKLTWRRFSPTWLTGRQTMRAP